MVGLESGADDYLVKLFDPEELKARLHTGLRILQLEDSLLEAREEMRYKATHDSLTSLLSRGTIVELLAHELTRTRRESGCTTAVLADLDHFKQVNDSHGHLLGDEILREVAKRMLGSVRSYDFVGRYGGEEFLLVLNNCDQDKSLERAEQIRAAICRSPISTIQGPLPITASLGSLQVPAGKSKPSRSFSVRPTALSTPPNPRAATAAGWPKYRRAQAAWILPAISLSMKSLHDHPVDRRNKSCIHSLTQTYRCHTQR